MNQAGNSSTDGLVFTDASIILRALVLGLLILVTVFGEFSFDLFHRSSFPETFRQEIR